MTYRRDRFTWTAFGALFAFGFLLALIGPALPYIRSVERISYIVAALHQVAFAIGVGLAGALSARDRPHFSRRSVIAVGLAGGGLAALAVGYGDTPPVTIAGALLMGLLGTLALIRLWASVADAHGPLRAVAMTEGEVAVSLAGVITPLLIGALATSFATWRLAFAVATAIVAVAVVGIGRVDFPTPRPTAPAPEPREHTRIQPTLVIILAIVALEFALSFWLSSYLNEDIGLSPHTAVSLVSILYASNLAGRLLASRLARTHSQEGVLGAALAVVVTGLPFLLAARTVPAVLPGIVLAGAGIGALFPMTSSLHVQASRRTADSALGEILTVAAVGQLLGPFLAGAIAQASGLRTGLFVLPAFTLLAACGLLAHQRHRSDHPVARTATMGP